jgi:hypothetical protein
MPTRVFLYLPPPAAPELYREKHPYGPITATLFFPYLGVEIHPTAIDASPALAAVDGLARVIADTDAGIATVVVKPRPKALLDLKSVTGASSVVFVYSNLELPTVRARFLPLIEAEGHEPFLSSEPLDNRVDRFINGAYGVSVDGGTALGTPSKFLGSDEWGRLGFVIAFVPGGLKGDVGWTRLAALVSPNESRTRRLDPVAFYAAVEAGTPTVSLDPSHAGHTLLTDLTRRSLLEIRDEYDKPLVGSVDVTESTTGVTTTRDLPLDLNGHVVLETVPAGTSTPAVDYTIAIANHVFTDLPSGDSAEPTPTRTLTAPAHWAVQQIFMADVTDPANWFVPNTATLPRFTAGNRVTPLIDGIPAYVEMVKAMRTVKDGFDHFVRLANWWFDDSFEMQPGETDTKFLELATAMSTAGAQVYALLSYHNPISPNHSGADHIQHLPIFPDQEIIVLGPDLPGQAILDREWPLPTGSAHQKFLIVNGEEGAIAFCGGVDINPNRLDTPQHPAELSHYHDVHAKVEGPAVADINHTFVQRWNEHPQCPVRVSEDKPPFAPAPSTHYVQVTRTFAPSYGYPFLPNGDLGTLSAVHRAIARANRFIYLEDQYLTPYPGPYPFDPTADSVGILSDLLTALGQPSFEYLVVLVANEMDLATDYEQIPYRRFNFLRSLLDAFPEKVFPFYLASDRDIYVHAKVLMVDDVYVRIGSANLNRRSMTHDIELDIHVIDGALESGARRMARRFRLDLWGEHLNMGGGRDKLEDPTQALHFWQNPPPGAHIRPYNTTYDYSVPHDDVVWNTFIDPEGC